MPSTPRTGPSRPAATPAPAPPGPRARLRAPDLTAPAALLLGGALVAAAAALGVLHGPGVTAVPLAALTALLPGVLALLVTLLSPVAGTAVAAGAGVLGVVRLLTDPFVALAPEQVLRPEFLVPAAPSGQGPQASFAGTALLLLGDLAVVAAGVLAARRLESSLRGRTSNPAGAAPGGGPGRDRGEAGDREAGDPRDGVAAPNVPMVAVGLVAVVGLLVQALRPLYTGGYVDDSFSLPSDLGSVLGPFVLALLAAALVVRASGLPRPAAVGLLAGAALLVALPLLTAVVAVSRTDALQLAAVGVWTPLWLVVLVLSGLLSRVRLLPAPADQPGWATGTASGDPLSVGAGGAPAAPDDDDRPEDALRGWQPRPTEPLGTIGAAVLALAGAALLLAPAAGLLRLNGTTPSEQAWAAVSARGLSGTAVRDQAVLQLRLAGVLVLAAAVVVVVGALLRRRGAAAAARTAAAVLVVLPVAALAAPLGLLAVLQAGRQQLAGAMSTGGSPALRLDDWMAGPGAWLAGAAAVAVLVGAAIGLVVLVRQRDDDPDPGPGTREADPSDDPTAEPDPARRRRLLLRRGAGGLVAALVLLAAALPVWRIAGGPDPTTLLSSADDAWTLWLVAVAGIVAGVVVATARGATGLGAGLAAALLLVPRLVVTDQLAAQPGWQRAAGTVVGWVCVAVVVLVVAAVTALDRSPAGLPAAPVPVRQTPAAARPAARGKRPMGSAPHAGNRRRPRRPR